MDVRAFSHKSGVDLDSGRSNLTLHARELMSYAARVIVNLESQNVLMDVLAFASG